VTASCCSVFNVTVVEALFLLCLLYCEGDVQNFGQNISESVLIVCLTVFLLSGLCTLQPYYFSVSVSSVGEERVEKRTCYIVVTF